MTHPFHPLAGQEFEFVDDWTERPRLALPSFGELVHTWIGYLDGDIYRTDPEGGWSDEQDYPPDVYALGVA